MMRLRIHGGASEHDVQKSWMALDTLRMERRSP